MKTINFSKISVDVHDGPIGVSISGGADSAILLYILMKNHDGPIYAYTCSNSLKHHKNSLHALQVITKCIELTGSMNITHRTFFVPQQSFSSLFDNLGNLYRRDGVEVIYTSVTALPPRTVTDSFYSETPLRDKRDPGVIRPLYNGPYYSPFFNVDKAVIKSLYEECDVLEQLFPVTRSCETIENISGHCGKCWWCEERYWGFGRL